MRAPDTTPRSREASKPASAQKANPEVKERLINPRAAYDWSRISNELDDMALSAGAFRVYCNLLRRSDKHSHTCYPGTRRIAHDCRLNRETVIEALRELEERGMLKVERGWGKRSDYEIKPLSSWKLVGNRDQSEIGTGPNEEPETGRKEEPVGNKDRNPIHSSSNPIQENDEDDARESVTAVPAVDCSSSSFSSLASSFEEELHALAQEFGITAAQVKKVSGYTKDKGIAYVRQKAAIVRAEPRENTSKTFMAALRDDWAMPKQEPKPERKRKVSTPVTDELRRWRDATTDERRAWLRSVGMDEDLARYADPGQECLLALQRLLVQEAACAGAAFVKAQQSVREAA